MFNGCSSGGAKGGRSSAAEPGKQGPALDDVGLQHSCLLADAGAGLGFQGRSVGHGGVAF